MRFRSLLAAVVTLAVLSGAAVAQAADRPAPGPKAGKGKIVGVLALQSARATCAAKGLTPRTEVFRACVLEQLKAAVAPVRARVATAVTGCKAQGLVPGDGKLRACVIGSLGLPPRR